MHKPVLLKELIEMIYTTPDGVYLDCTGGGGGHALELYKKISDKGKLFILDRDLDACKRLKEKFKSNLNVKVIHGKFSDFDEILKKEGVFGVDGLYADFGISNYHLQDIERGFSFRKNAKLDMRMDRTESLTAYDVVNNYSKETLANIIKKYGEERFADKIANEIVKCRAIKKIEETVELAEIIKKTVPAKFHKQGIHPATKSFQAIRIYINKELEEIETLLKKLEKNVKEGGRVGFISFHSLEDRLVKEALQYYAKDCVCPPDFPQCVCDKKQTFRILTKKPVVPEAEEIQSNSLSRSAKLRVAERV